MFTAPDIKMVNYVLVVYLLLPAHSVKEKKLYISERINNWSLVSVLQYPLQVIHTCSYHHYLFISHSQGMI